MKKIYKIVRKFYGNPGIGKTTIANLIAKSSNKKLFKLNGTTSSVKDIQEIAKTLDTLEGYNGVVVYLGILGSN